MALFLPHITLMSLLLWPNVSILQKIILLVDAVKPLPKICLLCTLLLHLKLNSVLATVINNLNLKCSGWMVIGSRLWITA